MPKEYFLPTRESVKAQAFEQFRDNISAYATLFELDVEELAQQAADATYFAQLLVLAKTLSSAGPQWNGWKALALTGTLGEEPAFPVRPTGFPAAVAPGIQTRFLALARKIKNHKNYTAVVGEILALEGADKTGPDLATLRPHLGTEISGNQVTVKWGWQGHRAALDMLELQVDRGGGAGFILLAYDTTPGYVDTEPLPAAPTKWTYRAIYRVGDGQVGQWSLPVSLTVGG